mmetsp:Transcript_6759/g.11278  ORF Transcript_6759/g.11278 Transcript_6759/m.11278 type:complete len:411 (+) Transcript_6759:768-2000(+)
MLSSVLDNVETIQTGIVLRGARVPSVWLHRDGPELHIERVQGLSLALHLLLSLQDALGCLPASEELEAALADNQVLGVLGGLPVLRRQQRVAQVVVVQAPPVRQRYVGLLVEGLGHHERHLRRQNTASDYVVKDVLHHRTRLALQICDLVGLDLAAIGPTHTRGLDLHHLAPEGRQLQVNLGESISLGDAHDIAPRHPLDMDDNDHLLDHQMRLPYAFIATIGSLDALRSIHINDFVFVILLLHFFRSTVARKIVNQLGINAHVPVVPNAIDDSTRHDSIANGCPQLEQMPHFLDYARAEVLQQSAAIVLVAEGQSAALGTRQRTQDAKPLQLLYCFDLDFLLHADRFSFRIDHLRHQLLGAFSLRHDFPAIVWQGVNFVSECRAPKRLSAYICFKKEGWQVQIIQQVAV